MNIFKPTFLILSFVLFLLYSICSFSWNALGHMVIAQIAYDSLKPEVKNKVDMIVRDLGKEYSYVNSFYQLGPWADSMRTQKIDIYSHWHYIDLAFSDDGSPLRSLEDTDNVVWAIEKIEPVVANHKANPYERARFLAFLVHLIGDMHQPLHTTSRISVFNPYGDQGGNLFRIKFHAGQLQTISLHKLWDQGIDVFAGEANFARVESLSKQITALYPAKYFDTKIADLKPDHWASEGLQTSTTFVYSTPENQMPSNDYLQCGRQMAQQKAALAGYRLAAVLNKLLS